MFTHKRMQREVQTLQRMIWLYCRKQHNAEAALCPECQELLDYAENRLQKCPYQQNKTTCAKCPTHCYKPEMRERIKQVMRFAGPRMLFVNPVLAILHLLDGLRKNA